MGEMGEILDSGNGTPPAPESKPGTAGDLRTEFETGKSRLRAEKEVGIKRGRGRPTKAEVAARRKASGEPEPMPAPPAPAPSFKPVLSLACQAPFQYLEARTGFPGWKVEAAEVEPAAQCFDDVCKVVFPQVASGPWALAISGVLCLGMLFLGRLPEFSKWQSAQVPVADPPPLSATPVTYGERVFDNSSNPSV